MAFSLNPETFEVHAGQNGYREVAGTAAFTTTASTYEVPCRGMKKVVDFVAIPIGAVSSQQTVLSSGQLGTISATQIVLLRATKAGTISAMSFWVSTTVTTDDTNYWSVGVVNKGAAGSGTTVVVDSSDATNTNKVTGGSAFTAYVPRALTLTSTAADLVVAEGDILAVTFTKTASAANLVNLSTGGRQSTSGTDETLYLDETLDADGKITVPSTGTITLTRTGANKTSGLKFFFRVRGR